jgi:hypothetical protein
MRLASAGILLGMFAGTAYAQEEDMSAAFQADLERIGAAQASAAAGATVTEHSDGMRSAVVGVSHMKMLMVRKNADGTLSLAHVDSAEEAEEFAAADSDDTAAEEE